jgi:hypothetical protein
MKLSDFMFLHEDSTLFLPLKLGLKTYSFQHDLFERAQSDVTKPTRLNPSKACRMPGTWSRIDGIQNLNCIMDREVIKVYS